MLHPDARISATMQVKIQSHPGERWTVSCCALNKRDGRSLTYHETGEVPNGPACERCGLSVFRKIEELRRMLRHLWNKYPARTYGSHVVKRELSASDGKIKQTRGPGHYTWWAYDGVTRMPRSSLWKP